MRSTHCLPSYSFGGHDVFDAIPKFTKLYGKSVAIIGGETALSKALPHIRPVLDKAGIKCQILSTLVENVLLLEARKLHKWHL